MLFISDNCRLHAGQVVIRDKLITRKPWLYAKALFLFLLMQIHFPLTLLPATVFCDVCQQRGGGMAPRHISSAGAHSDKITTATPMFSGSNVLVVVLRVSWDVEVC